MRYYTKKPHKGKKKIILLIIIALIIIFNLFIYFYDTRVFPSALKMSEVMVKAKTNDIISDTSIELFNDEFKYDEMIKIDKDEEGNINLVRANTVKLNYLTSKLSMLCNERLQQMGDVGIDVPMGWISEKSVFYDVGPMINVKIKPIGNLNVSYESKFESAGINQTRHIIYLNIVGTVRIMLPLHSEDIEVTCEIPVAETIIIGKIPNTAIDFKN
ncbi:MAG: sporulation protein YunB [Clostridiales bacterium]|nr:sporulation protein YunB [Clostridiales bacterium]